MMERDAAKREAKEAKREVDEAKAATDERKKAEEKAVLERIAVSCVLCFPAPCCRMNLLCVYCSFLVMLTVISLCCRPFVVAFVSCV